MAEPILFAVDDDPETLAALAAALERRFGADYRVLTDSCPSSALARLGQACEAGEKVALVIAGLWGSAVSGIEWLAQVQRLCPRTSRCVLVSYGQPEAYPLVRRALALGQIDTYLLTPCGDPEERLYPVVTEILARWTRTARPCVPVLQIVGERWAARSHELRDLLDRASVPYEFSSHDSDEGRALLARVGHSGGLPAVIFRGQCLADPSNVAIAQMLGVCTEPEGGLYDLAIVGAGPSGLATAVYGASSGLRTIVVERQVVGGQAGSSAMIRNYLGFPRGISGAELASRAHEQAMSLGVEFLPTREVDGVEARGAERVVTLGEATEVRARAVVIATGVSYNRLDVDGVDALIGKGVFYGGATAEAPAFAGRDVFVVGGGDSAGQAASHLSRYAARVTVLVRASSCPMSDYLIRQIGRSDNVRIRMNTELVRATGQCQLESITLQDTVTGACEEVPAAALFVMIGAGPHTAWLEKAIQRDQRDFILTGSNVVRGEAGAPVWPEERAPLALETSMPGVFATGDVRHRSARGVSAAVADGALAIRSVREYLGQE